MSTLTDALSILQRHKTHQHMRLTEGGHRHAEVANNQARCE